jgi:hypothetical protein
MTTRREILQAGAVLGAAAAPGAAALAAAPAKAAAPLGFYKVAFDSRFEPSLAFAAEAKRLGADVFDTRGDITGLYAEHLLPRWREAPAPVAGMTPYASMFVLEMMASAAGLRMVYRAHHDRERGGHAQFGPTAVLAEAGDLTGSHLDWSRKAARIVMGWPKAATARSPDRSTIIRAHDAALAHNTLVSWVLAPAARA